MSQIPIKQAVRVGEADLPGDLVVPANAVAMVLFVHGSASSRASPRNQGVASVLRRQHLGTLLFDLLTEEEARTAGKNFDIDLLAQRTSQALRWVEHHPSLKGLALGLLGASTGAAAALAAAAQCPEKVMAVVSRGGRPDLATVWLPKVKAPTLLIVGGRDTEVLALNREAMRRLTAPKRLEVVPEAGHLFEEPGALSSVAAFAANWFYTHLAKERAT